MSEKQSESERLLSELESLNNTLDNDPFDLDSEQQLEDLPVLKSFVEDVPVLSERIASEETKIETPPSSAASSTKPNTESNTASNIEPTNIEPTKVETTDDSDPLAISDFVKQQRAANLAAAAPPQKPIPNNNEPEDKPSSTRERTPARSTGTETSSPLTSTTPSSTKLENNPFLPQSAKDRIRDSHVDDASAELHKLLRQSAKASFNDGQGSPEYQRLRQKATSAINEIVKTQLPRLEAELRMRLEAEVDAMIREQNKE